MNVDYRVRIILVKIRTDPSTSFVIGIVQFWIEESEVRVAWNMSSINCCLKKQFKLYYCDVHIASPHHGLNLPYSSIRGCTFSFKVENQNFRNQNNAQNLTTKFFNISFFFAQGVIVYDFLNLLA